MPRYIVSRKKKDGWYGCGSVVSKDENTAIATIQRYLMKKTGEWKAKLAKKAGFK